MTSAVSKTIIGALIGACVFGLAGLGAYFYMDLQDDLRETEEQLVAAHRNIEALQGELSETTETLEASEWERERLAEELRNEQERMNAFHRAIEEAVGTVGILQQLYETDQELLQKYSRTYFLSEHYIPSEIALIEEPYRHNPNRDQWVHARVKPFLIDMIEDAETAGVELQVVSGYRSFHEQSDLSARYHVHFGQGANQFSAEQGYSEHQLGTAVDFTSPETSAVFTGFGNTNAYAWLQQNAHRYGFILSYPEDNPYYIFEPWHWRFVGVRLATDLHERGMHFYDMPQREIDDYLIYIFDRN